MPQIASSSQEETNFIHASGFGYLLYYSYDVTWMLLLRSKRLVYPPCTVFRGLRFESSQNRTHPGNSPSLAFLFALRKVIYSTAFEKEWKQPI